MILEKITSLINKLNVSRKTSGEEMQNGVAEHTEITNNAQFVSGSGAKEGASGADAAAMSRAYEPRHARESYDIQKNANKDKRGSAGFDSIYKIHRETLITKYICGYKSIKHPVCAMIPIRYIKTKDRDGYGDMNTVQTAKIAECIRKHGILMPLLVSKIGKNRFILLDGEDRLDACKALKLNMMQCLILPCGEDDAMLLREYLSLKSNLSRNLTGNSSLNDLYIKEFVNTMREYCGFSEDSESNLRCYGTYVNTDSEVKGVSEDISAKNYFSNPSLNNNAPAGSGAVEREMQDSERVKMPSSIYDSSIDMFDNAILHGIDRRLEPIFDSPVGNMIYTCDPELVKACCRTLDHDNESIKLVCRRLNADLTTVFDMLYTITDQKFRGYCIDRINELFLDLVSDCQKVVENSDKRYNKSDMSVVKDVRLIFNSIDKLLCKLDRNKVKYKVSKTSNDNEYVYLLEISSVTGRQSPVSMEDEQIISSVAEIVAN